MKAARPEAGFTLLEVLVAGVIAALALAGLFRTGLDGLLSVRVAGQVDQAVSLARSHLALAAAGVGGAAEAQGRDGAFSWRTRVAPVAAVAGTTGNDLAEFVRHAGERQATLYGITASVSWTEAGRTRTVQLNTERLGFAPAGAPQP